MTQWHEPHSITRAVPCCKAVITMRISMVLSSCCVLSHPSRPQAELLQALQEHISSTLGLFEGQSLSTTIWALAKLQDMAAVQAKLSPQPSTPDQGTAGGTLSSRSQSAAAFTAAGTAAAGAGGEVVPVVPQQLVQSLLWRCNPQMHHWSGRDIAQAAWGLAKLGARPNATWRLVRGPSRVANGLQWLVCAAVLVPAAATSSSSAF